MDQSKTPYFQALLEYVDAWVERANDLQLGTTATTAAAGNDSRLSDARPPTAHASTHHTAGSDPLAAADIGAEPALGNPASNG